MKKISYLSNPVDESLALFEKVVSEKKIFRRPHLRSVRQYLTHIFGDIALDGKHVLDIGGGIGLLSLWAAHRGAVVTCLEPQGDGSSSGVEHTFNGLHKEIGSRFPVDYLRITFQQFVQQSAKSFDVILLINCINHLNEEHVTALHKCETSRAAYRGILEAIASALQPSGKLLITDCSRRNLFADMGFRNPLLPTIEWNKHQAPAVWMELLSQIGFHDFELGWSAPDGLGPLGQLILGNRVGSYVTTSMFRLVASRPSC